jgi:hypothetical protein
MSSQAEALQQLMGFFLVGEQALATARFQAPQHGTNGSALPRAAADHAPPHAPAAAKAALPAKRGNGTRADGGFKKF